MPGLARLCQAVRDASGGETRLLLQIIDFLRVKRRPPKERFFADFLSLEPRHRELLAALRGDPAWLTADDATVRAHLVEMEDGDLGAVLSNREMDDYLYGYRERIWDMHLPHVVELPRVLPPLFADAASHARAAGFDGVELHYAHAYTMASFLSALNTREDGYGGSRENRIRLPLEVVAAVRERVGRDWAVGVRFLGDDVIEGGNGIEDASWFGVELARAGVDYLSVSKGGKFEDAKQPKVGAAVYPYTGPSGYECMPTIWSDARGPFGRNVALAATIRTAVRAAGLHTPIVTSGGICTFDQAEQILASGGADIIAAARQTLADPDWFLKARLGRGGEIRRCSYTNYCEGLDQQHKQVTCKLWDRDELDAPVVALDRTGRRRLIAPKWRR